MTVALVTGANRGLGFEFVKQYAADGWRVVACCRAPEKSKELKALSGDIEIIKLDVTDHARLKEQAAKVDEPVNLVIVNAGYGTRGEGDFGGLDYDEWKRFVDVNLYGAVATAEAFAPHVKKAKGKIAIISSKMGSMADASGGAMAYRTSKAAVNMATIVIADALAASGVAVGVFHPGWVQTDMGGPNALIGPEESIAALRQRFEEMQVTRKPKFLAYDGAEIPW